MVAAGLPETGGTGLWADPSCVTAGGGKKKESCFLVRFRESVDPQK